MFRGRWWSGGEGEPAVRSLLALRPEEEEARTQFAVTVRHLYGRLLQNEVFGEDAAARVTELAYAIALPGVLVALFLFPAYHGLPPHPIERSFLSQASDHLFYVTYAFVVMGCAVIFQWEMLFPDALDVLVLTTLPIPLMRLLAARVTAVGLFLLLVHAGTSGLGCLFLPAVADQRCGFFRQLLAQVLAVSMSGASIVAALMALQAVLLSLPRGRVAEVVRSVVRVCVLAALMTILFLFPLTSHFLPQLLGVGGGGTVAVRWLPTFWFLGVYDTVMWDVGAPPVFHALARSGAWVTAGALLLAALTYPFGYQRRVRQLVEGSPLTRRRAGRWWWWQAMVDRVLFPRPRTRATGYLAVQTLLRTERLHLYLAMYAGVGAALVLSSVLALRTDGVHGAVVFRAEGLLMVAPLVTFWAVAGLHTAVGSPVAVRGSWIFRAISGVTDGDELRGSRRLTMCVALLAVLGTLALLDLWAPRGVPGAGDVWVQVLFGCGLTLILAELFFAAVRTPPFTGAARRTVNSLPIAFVRYFVLLPAFALSMTEAEAWAARSVRNGVLAGVALAGTLLCARGFRVGLSSRAAPSEDLTLIPFHDR